MYIAYKNAIQKRMEDKLDSIKTIDWYNRQYEQYEKEKAIAFPACYIEFQNPINWETRGDGLQIANVTIYLHLVVFDVADAPDPTMDLSVELHKCFHGKQLLQEDGKILSTAMVRTSSRIQQYDQLKVIVLGYDTTLNDYSTMTEYTEVNVGFNLSPIE